MNYLSQLAIKHGTDKWGHHFYTDKYEDILKHLKEAEIKLLEIGVGGYEFPDRGGGSLRMWKEYFQKGQIFAIDLYDKSRLQEPRIKIFQGSQANESFLKNVVDETGPLDIIVDDGSHLCKHQFETFLFLFDYLKWGGVYIIEDTQTSYWEDYGGSMQIDHVNSTINKFLYRVHCMHYITNGIPMCQMDTQIRSIQFFQNIIVVYKGENQNQV